MDYKDERSLAGEQAASNTHAIEAWQSIFPRFKPDAANNLESGGYLTGEFVDSKGEWSEVRLERLPGDRGYQLFINLGNRKEVNYQELVNQLGSKGVTIARVRDHEGFVDLEDQNKS